MKILGTYLYLYLKLKCSFIMLQHVERPQCYERSKDTGSRISHLIYFEIFKVELFQFLSRLWPARFTGENFDSLTHFPNNNKIPAEEFLVSGSFFFSSPEPLRKLERLPHTSLGIMHSRQIVEYKFYFLNYLWSPEGVNHFLETLTLNHKKRNSPISHITIKTCSHVEDEKTHHIHSTTSYT